MSLEHAGTTRLFHLHLKYCKHMKIKTGDNVMITAGKNKGKTGKVIQVFPAHNKLVVEGMNLTTKHLKKSGNQPGKKIEYSAPIHMSNVQLVDKDGKVGRVGYEVLKKDDKLKKVRVLKKAGTTTSIE